MSRETRSLCTSVHLGLRVHVHIASYSVVYGTVVYSKEYITGAITW